MHRRPFLRSATLALSAALSTAFLALPACAWEVSTGSGGERVVGSGKGVQDVRTLPAFRHVRVDAAVDVTVQPGTQPSATVSADDNLAALLETVVEDGSLNIRFKRGVSLRSSLPLRVQVSSVGLESASLNGSGDLSLNALRGEAFSLSLAGSGDVKLRQAQFKRLNVSLAGSGDMNLDGQADSLKLNLAGSGDIHAGRLLAQVADVNLSGSGDVRLHATERLAAQIAGSGDVAYSGQPKEVSKRVVGSGSVVAVK